MITRYRVHLLVTGLLLAACLVGTVAGISLGIDWKQSPVLADNVFSGITLTPNASLVYTGGSQMLVRSWDGTFHWGGQPGFVAAISVDGNYVVTSSGSTVTLLNSSGTQLWSRTMDGQIKAVAVSPNGTFVISADDKGNYNSWGPNGDFYGRNQTDLVKRVAISPTGDLVVATTEGGIRYFTPALNPVWSDNRSGSLDDSIIISDDGSTIITSGGARLSSHTSTGTLNWQTDVTDTAINDVACNEDCSLIVVGSQDNTVRAVDRYGKTHWTYPTGQWANAVAASRSGSVIAVGANDGTVFILDHSGNLLTQQKFTGRIQPRTLAVSRDGTRIAVADQYKLYGLSLLGITAGDTVSDTIFIAATLNPVPQTTAATVATPTPVVTETVQETQTAVPAATKRSPINAWTVVPAIGGALYIARRNGR
ncbi:MAG: WD40 repeat domain-containing protein [Methanoregula sp.]|jgi:WD40 repeat protein|uniref:WD40 repeat domain-containing protein n=1 Tax=Methanoregula sp. TaxID=2052170 RepID=UPI003C1702D7